MDIKDFVNPYEYLEIVEYMLKKGSCRGVNCNKCPFCYRHNRICEKHGCVSIELRISVVDLCRQYKKITYKYWRV